MKKTSSFGTALILLAGVFWGSMGLFVRKLQDFGLSSPQITSARLTLAAVFFWLILLLRDRKGLLIRAKDIPLFLGLGLGSILFFTQCYFAAIAVMPLSTAAILLYTSPVWVLLLSALFFRERLTPVKLGALVLAFAGCVLVSGFSGGGLTPRGLLLGLGSGLGYGLYSILGAVALRRYSPLTVTAWTFTVAGLGSLLITPPARLAAQIAASGRPGFLLLFLPAMALITAVVPFLSYTVGLRSVEAGRAAIFATVEPLVATLFGALVFREPLTLSAGCGMAMILAAVLLLNWKNQPGINPQS